MLSGPPGDREPTLAGLGTGSKQLRTEAGGGGAGSPIQDEEWDIPDHIFQKVPQGSPVKPHPTQTRW